MQTLTHLKHNQALWSLAYPLFAKHLLIKILVKVLGDILHLERWVLLFPSGDKELLSTAEGLPAATSDAKKIQIHIFLVSDTEYGSMAFPEPCLRKHPVL